MTPDSPNGRGPERWLVVHRAPEDLLDQAFRQRRARLRYAPRLGRIVAAALLLLGAGVGVGWTAATLRGGAATSEQDPVLVRMILHAPGATSVTVAGTFNGWDTHATPLVHGEDDMFFVAVPLARGRYEYLFVVDGERWVADPAALLTAPDDFGDRNSVLDV